MNLKNFSFRAASLTLLLGLSFIAVSCGSYKNIPYFQDKVINNPEAIDKHAGIVI